MRLRRLISIAAGMMLAAVAAQIERQLETAGEIAHPLGQPPGDILEQEIMLCPSRGCAVTMLAQAAPVEGSEGRIHDTGDHGVRLRSGKGSFSYPLPP